MTGVDDLGSWQGSVRVTEEAGPAWVPLMAEGGGAGDRRGGILYHAAISAGELGLPAVLLTEALLPRLGSPGSLVITISSVAALRGKGAYGAMKAALQAWNHTLDG
ncbi:PEP-utilizing enzyme [Streptomyces sp. NPDC052052]|uniref:PEP-utilizing enzyme n=1 Tax=Streptomyces sp. NPDC052052 TaxID=3154756 RepID=UPI00343F30A1